jgi:predicted nucleic acid-binding protein
MGKRSLKGSIYLDTNILVALFEGEKAAYGALWEFMDEAIRSKDVSFHTSALSFAELLVKPYRTRNETLARHYLQLAKSEDWLTVEKVVPTIIETAAALRVRMKLRLPDAMHLATAACAGCSYLLTFDVGITGLPNLDHPISGRSIGPVVEVIHPYPLPLQELSKALS